MNPSDLGLTAIDATAAPITIKITESPKTIEVNYLGINHTAKWRLNRSGTYVLKDIAGDATLLIAALRTWTGSREWTMTPEELTQASDGAWKPPLESYVTSDLVNLTKPGTHRFNVLPVEKIRIKVTARPKLVTVIYRGVTHTGKWATVTGGSKVAYQIKGDENLVRAALFSSTVPCDYQVTPRDLAANSNDLWEPPADAPADPIEPISKLEKVPYSDDLNPDDQIGAEEVIAQMIFYDDSENVDVSVDDANRLGKDILYLVLRRFRPDLFTDYKRE